MKNNKTRIIVVAVLAIVIVLATLYFLTDVFKSDKEMFFKTLSKNTESLNAFKVEEPKESKNAYDLKGNFEIKMDEQTNLDFDVDSCNSHTKYYRPIYCN